MRLRDRVHQPALAIATLAAAAPWACGSVRGGPDAVVAVAQPHAVLAGATWHALAVAADGSVVAWGCGAGAGPNGQCTVPSGITGAIAVAAGSYHSVALTSAGTLYAWGCKQEHINGGSIDMGQCNVPTTGKFVAIAAAAVVTLAVEDDGTVLQLGAGLPPPSGLDHVVAVAASTDHHLALKEDGTVVAWGCDPNTGTTLCSVPAGLNHVVSIRAFADEAIALKDDGSVVVWYRFDETDLMPPASAQNIATVGAAGNFVLAAKHDGSVVAWGACAAYDVCKIPQGLVVATK